MLRWVTATIALLGLAGAAPQAQAVVINPGQRNVSLGSGIATPGNQTLLDTVVRNLNTGGAQATLTQWVYRNNSDSTLSFRYQVANASSSLHFVSRMTTGSFAHYLTNVDFLNDTGGDAFIGLADRDFTGLIGFDLDIAPGQTTAILNIRTNATHYFGGGRSSIHNGGSDSGETFGLAPEPGSMVLLGIGALGLCGSHFWRRRGAPSRKS